MATYVEDIIQALKNLGGQAKLEQIYEEVNRIRTVPQTKNWKFNISGIIGNHCSDSTRFLGKDYFRKIDSGTYALRDLAGENSLQLVKPIKKDSKTDVLSLPESFETVSNIFRTIKEYRDYSDPTSSTWMEYIQEFFHILGFATEKPGSRLIILKDMGGHNEPKAIVGYFYPGENSEQIIPELNWESYLIFAANYHQVDWGILTNGLELKIFNYKEKDIKTHLFWPDLDGIIEDEKLDIFFSIYKVFSIIRNQKQTMDQNPANRFDLRLEFWTQLLNRAKTSLPLVANISPGKENWISIGAGKTGFGYAFVVRMTDAQVELYIDQSDARTNKRYFDTLYTHKERIEEIFGGILDWQRLDDKRACRVRYLIEDFGLLDKDDWPELQQRLIGTMVKLEKAFTLEIKKLR